MQKQWEKKENKIIKGEKEGEGEETWGKRSSNIFVKEVCLKPKGSMQMVRVKEKTRRKSDLFDNLVAVTINFIFAPGRWFSGNGSVSSYVCRCKSRVRILVVELSLVVKRKRIICYNFFLMLQEKIVLDSIPCLQSSLSALFPVKFPSIMGENQYNCCRSGRMDLCAWF